MFLMNLFNRIFPNNKEIETKQEKSVEKNVETVEKTVEDDIFEQKENKQENLPDMEAVDIEEQKKAIREVQQKMRDMSFKYAKENLSFWMKCNLVLNSIPFNEMREKGMDDDEINASIDWDKVNELFHHSAVEYDFNLFDSFHSFQEILDYRDQAISATVIDDLPYHKQTCKQCGKQFTLSYGQINWYERKGLHIPRRCECCRKGVKPNIQSKQVTKQPENKATLPEKTNMQIAFEKAGLI